VKPDAQPNLAVQLGYLRMPAKNIYDQNGLLDYRILK